MYITFFLSLLAYFFDVLRYFKRLIKYIQHKEETEEDVYTRWEKDYDLVPNSIHGLFYEYLELGMCQAGQVPSSSPLMCEL